MFRCQRLENKDPGARQQGANDLEAGILRGGADECDGAVFRRREQAILLGFVEPVDLVNKKNRLRPTRLEPLASLAHDLANPWHTLGHGAEGYEFPLSG